MSKYLIEFTRFDASIIAEYDDEGRLISAILNYGTMAKEQLQFLFNNFPVISERLEKYKTVLNVKVSEVATDLSFECFWDAYKNKLGDKKRSLKLWDLLSDESKMKALKYITIYDQELIKRPGVVKKYPETYLSKTPWEN